MEFMKKIMKKIVIGFFHKIEKKIDIACTTTQNYEELLKKKKCAENRLHKP